jgi:hypothetical protein
VSENDRKRRSGFFWSGGSLGGIIKPLSISLLSISSKEETLFIGLTQLYSSSVPPILFEGNEMECHYTLMEKVRVRTMGVKKKE